MRLIRLTCFVLLLITWGLASAQSQTRITATGNTTRPWTYWWWMGSGVSREGITRQLEQFAQAGLGGVHIIPIYGVRGYESQFKSYLKPEWLAHFQHTIREANRLGLGVDLTTGTGWPFGGPNVTAEMAAKQWKLQNGQLSTVMTRQQVKRAAPGGEGLVLDPFNKTSVQKYLTRFDSTLVALPEQPRAVYNDSYEVYGANWTDNFLAEFRQRRGYDLTTQLTAFLDTTLAELSVRVKQDYHQTLSDLLTDQFTTTWTAWARQHRYQSRNQAHGSPGNLLDLYALADIPETESFGSSRFPIPGLRVDEDYEVDRFGTPHPLAMKFASSAANLLGKKLVSSETTTWLANHFKVSLSQIKPQVDELFTAGINHIFFHGTTYSPPGQDWPGEAWPGWLFYASTNYGPSSHFWNELPQLTRYIERCQTRLQNSQPDNDVLVYFPIHDLWATPAKSIGGIHQLEVHHIERWLLTLPFGKLCDRLRQQGYSFDYVSDAQLADLTVSGGRVQAKGGRYRVVLVLACRYMPERTLQQLAQLAEQGATIVFDGKVPEMAPGFNEAQRRNTLIETTGQRIQVLPTVRVGLDVVRLLNDLKVPQETMTVQGLTFIRKQATGKPFYFVTNLGDQFTAGWVTLTASSPQWYHYNPLTDQSEALLTRQAENGQPQVWLRLLPGQSCFIVPPTASSIGGGPLNNKAADYRSVVQLGGPWQFSFLSGKPAGLPPATFPQLTSWTTLSDSASYFSGVGRYSTTFNLPTAPNPAATYWLDLGDVRETARVSLNGQEIGVAWSIPFEVELPTRLLRQEGNQLTIEVTNLSANYMRLRDGKLPTWKKFYEINFVDIRYRPFDATKWKPMPSGLLGPVRVLSNL